MCKLLMNAYFEQEYERNIQKQQKEKEILKNDDTAEQQTKTEKQDFLKKILAFFK